MAFHTKPDSGHHVEIFSNDIFDTSVGKIVFTPQPLRAVGVLFSPMVSGWAGGRVAGKSLSGLYLRNRKV